VHARLGRRCAVARVISKSTHRNLFNGMSTAASEIGEEAELTEKQRWEFAENPQNNRILKQIITKTYLPPDVQC
jgi:hypothetical protein